MFVISLDIIMENAFSVFFFSFLIMALMISLILILFYLHNPFSNIHTKNYQLLLGFILHRHESCRRNQFFLLYVSVIANDALIKCYIR